MSDDGIMRRFHTGATRSSENGKPDFEGYLSPLAIEAYGEYMLAHQKQADGTIRPSDNWQKGIPQSSYVKSMWRHFLQVWKLHRGYEVRSPEDGHLVSLKEALCGLLFNVQGMLHEVCKEQGWVYISGKISDTTYEAVKKNLQRFMDKAAELRGKGLRVYNPAEHEDETKKALLGTEEWKRVFSYYLALDTEWIIKHRPRLYMLKGWETSLGANIEHSLAKRLGLEIEYEK